MSNKESIASLADGTMTVSAIAKIITEEILLEALILKNYPYISIGSPNLSRTIEDFSLRWDTNNEHHNAHENEKLNHIRRVRGYTR